jgi:dolichol-phosphate mannosyltransferase
MRPRRVTAPPDISVVLPAYREEENLRLLLPRIRAVLEGTGRPFEILVVDTAEPMDHTADVAADHGARLVRRRPTNVYGDAVRSGIDAAHGAWILFMDCDGSHAPELIPALLDAAREHDVVIGSRYVQGGYTENPWVLRLMSRAVNVVYTLVLGLPVRDVSNSLRLYRADLLREPVLRCSNFDVIEEVLFKIRRLHPEARFVEVPVGFRKRMFGETKRNLVSFALSYGFTLLKLRFAPRPERRALPPARAGDLPPQR